MGTPRRNTPLSLSTSNLMKGFGSSSNLKLLKGNTKNKVIKSKNSKEKNALEQKLKMKQNELKIQEEKLKKLKNRKMKQKAEKAKDALKGEIVAIEAKLKTM